MFGQKEEMDEKWAIKLLTDRGYHVDAPGTVAKQQVFSKNVIGIPSDRNLGFGSLQFFATLRQMWITHLGKNAGYAGEDNPDSFANFRECEALGVSAFKGTLIRMSDKWSRAKSLLQKESNDQVGESLLDTLLDLANYAVIASCLYEENLLNKKVEDRPIVDVAAFMRP